MAGSSTSHYRRQVQHLEAVLESKLKQLSLLEQENKLLLDKGAALQNAIDGLEGPLSVVKAVLAGSSAPNAAQECSDCATHDTSHSHSTSLQQPTVSNGSDCTGGSVGGVERSGNSATSGGNAAKHVAYKDSQAMLGRLDAREEKVQQVMQQLGCFEAAGYKELYTTQLLHKAVADPERMAGYLNMPKPERLKYWCNAHTQMALLLGKYDSNLALKAGGVREQLDYLTDELFERVTVCALLDPPPKYMQCFMFNVETHEFEQYPDNWWRQVAQGIDMSSEQKAAIKLVWDRVKVEVEQATQEYSRLQQKLQQHHLQQLLQNRCFVRDIQQLPSMQNTLMVAERMLQQQQQQHQHQQQLLQQAQAAQQQQSHQQQQQAQQGDAEQLQQLRDFWQHDQGPGTGGGSMAFDAAGEQFLAELAAAFEAEQQREQQLHLELLQQQQQPGSWGWELPCPPTVPNGVAAGSSSIAQGVSQTQLNGAVAAMQIDSSCQPMGLVDPSMLQCVGGVPAAQQYDCGALQQHHAQAWVPLEQQQQPPGPVLPLASGHSSTLLGAVSPVTPLLATPGLSAAAAAHAAPSAAASPSGFTPAAAAATSAPGLVQGIHSPPSAGMSGVAAGSAGHVGSPVLPPGQAREGGVSSGCTPVEAGPVTAGTHSSRLAEAEEVLLQAGSEERRRLERRMQACNDKIKVLNFCVNLQLTNTLSKKQLAAMCVHSHPFVFDALSICESLDEVGWEDC